MGLMNAIRGSYGALRCLTALTKLINPFCRRFDRAENSAVRAAAALPPGRLNGQGLPPVCSLPYGAWTMGNNGCEVIAVYNALQSLGRPTPLAEVADALERRGLLFNGFGGTNLPAVAGYLRARGVEVTVLRRRARAGFDAALNASGCAILSFWTGATLRRRGGDWNTLHTVFLRRTPEGVEVCNCVNDSPAPYTFGSVADLLRRFGDAPVCLFALKSG